MSKITNLIGTTWRLDGNSLNGLIAEYGVFNIIGNADYNLVLFGTPIPIQVSFEYIY